MDIQRWGFEPGAVVVITGAGSGIGQATARRCAQLGLAVGVWDIDAVAAQHTASELTAIGATALAYEVDVTDEAGVAAAFAATVTSSGRSVTS
jgi:NAD(P)-dependent dehydrogenase (short-subunit alcohol dehydrogenase family)